LFKKALALLLVLVVFTTQASADAFLIEPISGSLKSGDSAELGNVARGETIRVVMQRQSGTGFQWDKISFDNSTLLSGWDASFELQDKTIIAIFKIPKDAAESIQRISFTLESNASPVSKENFSVYVTVKKNLLSASMEGLKQESEVGVATKFKLIINNESIAPQRISVKSSLPNYWFESASFEVEPLQTLDVNLLVYPANYGQRNFSFSVKSELNDFSSNFAAELAVISSIRGKFLAPMFGLPFFTISLFPQLLVNAFLALL